MAGDFFRLGGLLAGIVILATAPGCYNGPKNSAALSGPAVETGRDNYVYYPAYGVYYNTSRHQYVYWEGRSWVNREDLPALWAAKLATTPQVPVDFHDAPEKHHAVIARMYPSNWHSDALKITAGGASQ